MKFVHNTIDSIVLWPKTLIFLYFLLILCIFIITCKHDCYSFVYCIYNIFVFCQNVIIKISFYICFSICFSLLFSLPPPSGSIYFRSFMFPVNISLFLRRRCLCSRKGTTEKKIDLCERREIRVINLPEKDIVIDRYCESLHSFALGK